MIAETWQPPDWFSSPAELAQTELVRPVQAPPPRHAAGTNRVRIVIVDGSSADERHLQRAAAAAGIDCHWEQWSAEQTSSAALLFEAGDDLELCVRGLRALRNDPHFAAMPALLSVQPRQVPQIEAALGFDDFVLQPCFPLEVRARIRIIERRRQQPEAPLDEALEEDGIQVDAVAHEALVDGRLIRLTAREFALFAYLRARPGRVLTRQHLLARVWGYRYRGGPRTVDTHIGRLRLKFADALLIETVRTNGYRLRPRHAPPVRAQPSTELATGLPEAGLPASERAPHDLTAADSASHAAE